MKSTAKIAIFLAVISIILIMPFASAQEIRYFGILIFLKDSKAYMTYALETGLSQIQLILPEDAKIINCSANYTVQNSEITVTNIQDKFVLSYDTEKFIERAGKSYFTANFKLPLQAENLVVRLILPEGSVLENSFPEAKLTSDGRHIILNWQVQNASNFPVFVTYNEKKGNEWLWILGIAIAIVIIALLIIKRKPKIKRIKAKKGKVKEIELHLLESENAVIKALKDAKGEMWQKQIQLKTGFSKAKLSRVIRNLEARGLVKRIPLGNTNKIRLLNR